MGKIVVDRGYEEFTIEDKKGNVLGKFEMNPSDMEFIKRYEDVAEKMSHVADNIDESKSEAEQLVEIETKVNELIDYLFNASVSASIFSITSPFSVLASGEFFIENVLNSIGKLVESETGKRFKKIQTKVSKYTSKYHGNSKEAVQKVIEQRKNV